VGRLQTGKIILVRVTAGTLNGINQVGGIAGNTTTGFALLDISTGSLADHGSLVYRTSTDLTINATGDKVGGLIGLNTGRVALSFAKTHLSGINDVGGLVGVNNGEIIESYAEPWSATYTTFGGLSSTNTGTITRSFSASSDHGLLEASSGSVVDSFYDSTLNGTSAAGTGLTNAQMQVQGNFTNWDFESHWILNTSYPDLRWER